MKRRARPVPFARRRITSVMQDLIIEPPATWPKHLRLARNILTAQMALDDESAQAVIIRSSAAAQACAQAINSRSREITYLTERQNLHKVFMRIAKCARRSPAALRHTLDRRVRSAISDKVLDTEKVEVLIQALIDPFTKFPMQEASSTVLRALRVVTTKLEGPTSRRRCFAKASNRLGQDYSALSAIDQRGVESALTSLRIKKPEFNASDVCESIASTLAADKGPRTTIHDLITEYVIALAETWELHRLKPSRSVRATDPSHRSKFHRFAELVLTWAVEPWSKRHDADFAQHLATLRKHHAQLSSDTRRLTSPAPRRSDTQWLVSEDHVKAALLFKKRASKLHTCYLPHLGVEESPNPPNGFSLGG